MSTDSGRPLTRREAREAAEADAALRQAQGPDAGTTGPDAGAPDPDAGTTGPDAGTPAPDAGTPGAEPRRADSAQRRGRAFFSSFAAVVAVLVVLGLAGAAIGTARGPHVTGVQVDPAAAAQASGSRLIVTTSQSLQAVDESQVTIEPAVPFAVDTSGRAVGVRFGLPLRDDTEYTVSFTGVEGLGGGPTAEFTHTFRTPPAEVYLLQRGGGTDTIFRTDLTGENAVKVFEHPHIEDFRTTAGHLIVSVRTDDTAELIATDLDGGGERTLPLPGTGVVANLQAADRGERIGYTFSDLNPGTEGALESVLFTTSLGDPDAEPQMVDIAGADPRVGQWRFVPDTDSILLLNFEGSLLLTDATGSTSTALGTAIAIDGAAATEAIVDRLEAVEVVDLTDGTSAPLVAVSDETLLGAVLPVPGGGTLRTLSDVGAAGLPIATRIVFVTDEGEESPVLEVTSSDAVVQTCVSPSGRYAAVLVAPDAVSNPYDLYDLPLPEKLQTHVVEIDGGDEVVVMAGGAISWCRVPPQ